MTAGDALAGIGSGLMASAQNMRIAQNNAQNAAAAYQSGLGNIGMNALLGNIGAPYQTGMGNYTQLSTRSLTFHGLPGPVAQRQFAAMVLKDTDEVAHQKRLAVIESETARLREANDHRQHELVELWFGPSPAS